MTARFLNKDTSFRAFRWLFQQLNGLVLAIKEHHHWVHSPRARALEEWAVRVSALLHYAAYLLFVWLAYRLWVGVPKAVAMTAPLGLFAARDSLDFRSGLFYVFAGAFLIPAGLFVVWFVVRWTYKLLEAVAYRWLPRFMRLPFYPLVLCGVALAGLVFQTPVAVLLARGYVETREVVIMAKQPGLGVPEHMRAVSTQTDTTANAQAEKLIEELRRHYDGQIDQQPPGPLELDVSRDNGSKPKKLIEEARKRHEDRSSQDPPEPLELELDAARSKGSKVD